MQEDIQKTKKLNWHVVRPSFRKPSTTIESPSLPRPTKTGTRICRWMEGRNNACI